MLLTDLTKQVIADIYPDYDPTLPIRTYKKPSLTEKQANSIMSKLSEDAIKVLKITKEALMEEVKSSEYLILNKTFDSLSDEEKEIFLTKLDELALKVKENEPRAANTLISIFYKSLQKIAQNALIKYKRAPFKPEKDDVASILSLKMIEKLTGKKFSTEEEKKKGG